MSNSLTHIYLIGWRADEKDWERRRPRGSGKPWAQAISLMYSQFGYRVSEFEPFSNSPTKQSLFSRTLYCAKGNFEFGISRVMKSLEPYQKKLGVDTWYYTKRCFLCLFEGMSKHLILLKDAFIAEILQFLTHCESKTVFVCYLYWFFIYNHTIWKLVYGKEVKANVETPMDPDPMHPGRNTVAFEARYLKWLLLEISGV